MVSSVMNSNSGTTANVKVSMTICLSYTKVKKLHTVACPVDKWMIVLRMTQVALT